MKTASIQPSGAAALRHVLNALVDVDFVKIDRLGAGIGGERKPFRDGVDRDDAVGAEQERAADRDLTDRAAAPNRDRVARLDVAEVSCHVASLISDRNSTCSSLNPSGTFAGPISARGPADIRLGRPHSPQAGANSRTGRRAIGPTIFSR